MAIKETIVEDAYQVYGESGFRVIISLELTQTAPIAIINVRAMKDGVKKSAANFDLVLSIRDDDTTAPAIIKFDPGIAIGVYAACLVPRILSITYDQITGCYTEARKKAHSGGNFRDAFVSCLKAKSGDTGFAIAKAVAECLPTVGSGAVTP
ncbi:hypothetical protein [Rhodothalassium salexigens]|uniref:hypothetical protein n=1 Tax=Rhodothalassium salexigens TaxID=1086 RepID=UPI001043FF30|nr:hypothetical protein [Rhodothalassium salexigens]MBB4212182.1 hypothetical protein [Rhodothalassium salexigens DSM 2132]